MIGQRRSKVLLHCPFKSISSFVFIDTIIGGITELSRPGFSIKT
jgi:hypothetical protein